jgi:hypothetical protein
MIRKELLYDCGVFRYGVGIGIGIGVAIEKVLRWEWRVPLLDVPDEGADCGPIAIAISIPAVPGTPHNHANFRGGQAISSSSLLRLCAKARPFAFAF